MDRDRLYVIAVNPGTEPAQVAPAPDDACRDCVAGARLRRILRSSSLKRALMTSLIDSPRFHFTFHDKAPFRARARQKNACSEDVF